MCVWVFGKCIDYIYCIDKNTMTKTNIQNKEFALTYFSRGRVCSSRGGMAAGTGN